MNFTRGVFPSCPRVWVLTNPHPGNRIQAIALAEALDWPFEVKELHFTKDSRRRLTPRQPAHAMLDQKSRALLTPPWPDLVIGVGRSTAPVTRWISTMSNGQTRTVQLGRTGGAAPHHYDAVIAPLHCRMPPDPRRFDTIAPLNSISPQQLAEAGRQWPGLLDGLPRPVVGLLVGGDAARFRLGADDARIMAQQVRRWVEECGGSVMAVTSRRTSLAAGQALQTVLGAPHRLYLWQPASDANPYRALLAQADALVVTGESESMLAEAAATTAPLYVYPVTEIRRFNGRLREWCITRVHASSSRNAGSNHLDSALAWMIRRGVLRPRRDIALLHQALYASGRAQPFGKPLRTTPQPPLPPEAPQVARWLKEILRTDGRAHPE